MPDLRKLRGSHPQDQLLFVIESDPELRQGTCDLSGRLKTMLREISEERGWNWEIDLVPDPDPVLSQTDQIVASADSQILNEAERWFNLVRFAIETRVPDAWVVVLSRERL